MASNNTIKDQILTLFPDNNTQEISASDMRIFVHSIFGNKEELVNKATDEADMKINNTKIYENSVVLITAAGVDSGVYVSRVNQPISLLQLDKIADLAEGTVTPDSDISNFMIKYTHDKSYLNAVYSYTGKNISNTALYDGVSQIYDINYTYSGKNITQTAIQEVGGQQVIVSFLYTGNNITSKNYTL